MNRGNRLMVTAWSVLAVMAVVTITIGAWSVASAGAAETGTPAAAGTGGQDSYRTFGLAVGAGLAAGLSIIGAGLAIGRVGSAAMGALTEKPEMMGRAIVFVGLAEGIAVLGFAIAIMLWAKM
jgi:V/A-type H+/Na+-transporting ATPase subunit K